MSTKEPREEQSMLGHGHFTRGQWYCECHRVAHCRTIQKGKPYAGEKYWRCPRHNNIQCSFFLWVAHETAAKEWWITSHLPPVSQILQNEEVDSNKTKSPQAVETPFTKAKRKIVSGDILKSVGNEDRDNRKPNEEEISVRPMMVLDDPFTESDVLPESAQKVAKTSTASTPGQSFMEKLKGDATAPQTPNSKDHRSASSMSTAVPRTIQTPNTSPIQRHNNRDDINTTEELDTTTAILNLLRSNNIALKASTEMQICHVIQLQSDMGQTKLRRSEETILKLCERVDELETMIFNLT